MPLIERVRQFFNDKLKEPEIGWETRPYDFYLIFGQNEGDKLPWIQSNWKNYFEPYFSLLLQQAENHTETGVRVTKYKAEKRVAKKDNKEFVYLSEIKLGRLKWDSKSHEKWVLQNNIDEYFQDFELWSPTWTVCDKRGSPPDVFIAISNEHTDLKNEIEIQFGYFIVVAVAKNLNINSKHIISQLSEKINSKATIVKSRRWGKPENAGNWTFVNWIQDTFSNGIYNGKNIHAVNFNELEFEPVWEVIYRQK